MTKRVSEQQLNAALSGVLQGIGAPSADLTRGMTTGKRAQADAYYEMYVYALVVDVLRSLHALPTVKSAGPGGRFLVRRSHGDLSDKRTSFSYVEFQLNGTTYELHVDLYYKVRRGGGKLEVDVSITKESVASRCRLGYNERPSNRSLYLLLELKHYSGNASTNVATGYIGRCKKLHVRNRPEGLVLSHGMSATAKTHVTSENLHVYERLTPLRADVQNVQTFQNELSNWLRRSL